MLLLNESSLLGKFSPKKIVAELGLSITQAHEMTRRLRQGIADHQQPLVLKGEVECDDVYVVAGHKGYPAAVKKKGVKAAAGV